MHHRISSTLYALRQDLAARLGDDVIGSPRASSYLV